MRTTSSRGGRATAEEKSSPPPRGRSGFTLIEIMLVVVIIGIASAVAVPSFLHSMRGAKLRTSTRMVLSMHRNAQSKAVLGQRYVALLFDLKKGTLEMVEQVDTGTKADSFFGTVGGASTGLAAGAENGGGAGTAGVTGTEDAPTSLMTQMLADTVQFESFQGGREIDELYFVNYYPNGMCDGWRVELTDDRGKTARIRVDAITGKAKVEDEP